SWHANRALWRHYDFGMDNIFLPVALAGSHVARKYEIGQRRKRDIMRAADAGFQHPPAPNGNAVLLAKIVDAPHHRVAADATELDVDDLAGSELDGGARLLFRVDALVQADRRVQLFLQLDVAVEIVPAERLLDHHQVEALQLLE